MDSSDSPDSPDTPDTPDTPDSPAPLDLPDSPAPALDPRQSRSARASTLLTRVGTLFVVISAAVLYVGVSSVALVYPLAEPVGVGVDLWFGVTLCCVGGIMLVVHAHLGTRVAWVVAALNLVYWWLLPANGLLGDAEDMAAEFRLGLGVIWAIFAFLAAGFLVAFLDGLARLARNTRARRARQPRQPRRRAPETRRLPLSPSPSSPASPTTAGVPLAQRARAWTGAHRGVVVALVVLGVVALPGLVMQTPAYQPAITITPKDYDIGYKWWVHDPFVTSYSDAVLDELNEHACTLDLTGNYPMVHAPDNVDGLRAWEARCPNCHYRFVRHGPNIRQIIDDTKIIIEIMLAYEANGTLRNWLGVTYDIENPTFETLSGFNSTAECVAAWEAFFAWKRDVERTRRGGREIVVESVHGHHEIPDYWDGDADLQRRDNYVSVSPTDAWTVYAPMNYRCWYRRWMYAPYGSVEMDPAKFLEGPAEPFPTSYALYHMLYQTCARLPVSKRGSYIGLTNCSCYGRDLPQHERVSWFVPEERATGVPTGYGNLVRDVLICKHFEMREVTFFLLETASDDGEYIMGGAFEAYGVDFLDRVNATVNGAPPAEFTIWYTARDAKGAVALREDWLLDADRLVGALKVTSPLLAALAIGLALDRRSKPAPASKARDPPAGGT